MDSDPNVVEPSIEAVLSYAALGLIVGFSYYMSQRWNVGVGQSAAGWTSRVVLGLRLAAAIVFFAWLASLGTVPVLSAFVGFLAARVIAFRAMGEDV